VVAAIRDLHEDGWVLRLAEETALHLGAVLVIAHAVPRSFAERSVGLDAALERGQHLVDSAADLARAEAPGLPVNAQLFRMRPHELVSHRLDADLLVVGAPAARPLTTLDQVATAAVYHAQSSLLLVPKRI
jgi:nucleotide-binding universal stress UspA family protein